MNRMVTSTFALLASTALVLGASPSALATSVPLEQATNGVSLVDAIELEMADAGWDRTVDIVDGERFITFSEPDGLGTLTLPDEPSPSGGSVPPQSGVGTKDGRIAISFNQTDQAALLGGGQALLVVAICAVGPVACTAAGVATAFATPYLSEVGRCPSNDELWVYFRANGPAPGVVITGAECVPVSFPGGG